MLDPLYVGDIITSTLHGSPFPEGPQATMLLLGTVAVESGFLDRPERGAQRGMGYFQIAPQQEAYIWKGYLDFNAQLIWWFVSHAGQDRPNEHALAHNLSYSVLLARSLYYWRDLEHLPDPEDLAGQARHWRTYWRQSTEWHALEQAYVEAAKRLVVPHYPIHRVRKGG